VTFVEWQDRTEAVEATRQLNQMSSDVREMAEQHIRGEIDHMIDTSAYAPNLAEILRLVNEMVLGHIATKKKIVNCAVELARGNLDAPLEEFSGQRKFLNDAIEGVRANLKAADQNIRALVGTVNQMARAQMAGDVDARADASGLSEDYAEVVHGVNALVESGNQMVAQLLHVMQGFAAGDFDRQMDRLPGKKAEVNEAVESVRSNFREVMREITALSQAIQNGQFDYQIETTQFAGSYREIVETLEKAIDSLNDVIGTTTAQVEQIAVTVGQVSMSSQSLAGNAQLQSSSVDEVSASAEQTDEQVKSNAEAARAAASLVTSASAATKEGREKMEGMVGAMEGIRASSQDIGKIIKVIDEIAFQTNLLALNAAVEAARAGQHGRGFAVVAQEVRNLAGRSAKAAKETSDLIESAAGRVQQGVAIADQAQTAFARIAADIGQMETLVRGIAEASQEQAKGVAQINAAITEVAKSAVSTSGQAEELASSAAQMQASASSMREALSRFRLRKRDRVALTAAAANGLPPELMAQIQRMIDGQMASRGSEGSDRRVDRDARGYGGF
jgi:methyl-accepting chemotaxis protein